MNGISLGVDTLGAVHSVPARPAPLVYRIISTSVLKTHLLWSYLYRAQSIYRWDSINVDLMLCSLMLTFLRWPSHMDSNSVIISIILTCSVSNLTNFADFNLFSLTMRHSFCIFSLNLSVTPQFASAIFSTALWRTAFMPALSFDSLLSLRSNMDSGSPFPECKAVFEMHVTKIQFGAFVQTSSMPHVRSICFVCLVICLHYIFIGPHLDVFKTTSDSASARRVMIFGSQIVLCSLY